MHGIPFTCIYALGCFSLIIMANFSYSFSMPSISNI